jgi:hypothetical protein
MKASLYVGRERLDVTAVKDSVVVSSAGMARIRSEFSAAATGGKAVEAEDVFDDVASGLVADAVDGFCRKLVFSDGDHVYVVLDKNRVSAYYEYGKYIINGSVRIASDGVAQLPVSKLLSSLNAKDWKKALDVARVFDSNGADWWVLSDIHSQDAAATVYVSSSKVRHWVRVSNPSKRVFAECEWNGDSWSVSSYMQVTDTVDKKLSSKTISSRLDAVTWLLDTCGADWSFKDRTEYWIVAGDNFSNDPMYRGAWKGNIMSEARRVKAETPCNVWEVRLSGFRVRIATRIGF